MRTRGSCPILHLVAHPGAEPWAPPPDVLQALACRLTGPVQVDLYPRSALPAVWRAWHGTEYRLPRYAFRGWSRGDRVVIFVDHTETPASIRWLLGHELAHTEVSRSDALTRRFRSRPKPVRYLTDDAAHESSPEEQHANAWADRAMDDLGSPPGLDRRWWRRQTPRGSAIRPTRDPRLRTARCEAFRTTADPAGADVLARWWLATRPTQVSVLRRGRGLPSLAPVAPVISPRETWRRVVAGELILLDVRSRDEHAKCRFPLARYVPVDELERWLDHQPLGKKSIAAICLKGIRSDCAVEILRRRGYRAMSVEGGLGAWLEAGLPVEGVCDG